MASFFGHLDEIDIDTLSSDEIIDNLTIFEIFSKKYGGRIKELKNKLYKTYEKRITKDLKIIFYDFSFELLENEKHMLLGLKGFRYIKNKFLQIKYQSNIFNKIDDEKITNCEFIFVKNFLNFLNSFIETKLNDKIEKYLGTELFLEFSIALTNDLLDLLNIIFDKIDSIEITQEQKDILLKSYYQIKLYTNIKIELINIEISKMFLEELIEAKNEIKNTKIKNTKIKNTKIIDTVIVTLQDYFTDLQNWMIKKNFKDLLEKININFISSDLFDKNDESRNIFETYIQYQLDNM